MQPTHAAPLSLSVEMGGASPAGGSVMDMTIVGMELMSCLQPAVCYYVMLFYRSAATTLISLENKAKIKCM